MKTSMLIAAVVYSTLLGSLTTIASQPLPTDLVYVPPTALPSRASWFSVQRWGKYPPSPVNWCAGRTDVTYYRSPSFGTNRMIIDDRSVDYTEYNNLLAAIATPAGPLGYDPKDYGPSDLWLEIQLDPINPGYVDLTLHGATTGLWQLLSKTNLNQISPWTLGEIAIDDGSTTDVPFTTLPDNDPPMRFFRAVGGDTEVSISTVRLFDKATEPCSPTSTGQTGIFDITLSPSVPRPVTVLYTITGSAQNGVDYTNISSSVVIPPNSSSVRIFIQPLYDTLIEFEESATLSLILTNGYVVDPGRSAATIWVSDCSTNLFTTVATNLPSPVGIDYYSRSNSLILSYHYDEDGEPRNFALLNTNHTLTAWSGVHGLQDEVKIATVKKTANGFTNADLYFGSGPTSAGFQRMAAAPTSISALSPTPSSPTPYSSAVAFTSTKLASGAITSSR